MSKAMDALLSLENIAYSYHVSCLSREHIKILRDYITTTEAERAASGASVDELLGKLPFRNEPCAALEERSYEYSRALLDATFAAQRQLGRDESAARIKELEEALIEAEQSLHAIATQAGRDYLTDLTQIRGYANSRAMVARKVALSGARKVKR